MIGEKIFITGGAGYLGSHLVNRYYNNNDITVYSRDEAKHYYLKKRFPNKTFNEISADILKRNPDGAIIVSTRSHKNLNQIARLCD